jgi:hypothetical protein
MNEIKSIQTSEESALVIQIALNFIVVFCVVGYSCYTQDWAKTADEEIDHKDNINKETHNHDLSH